MAGRVLFFLQHASFEPAYQAASMGITAAAMGDEVYFVFAFDALRALLTGDFGAPLTERERVECARGGTLGLPSPAKMLAEARGLGARTLACDTTMKLCGFVTDPVDPLLDEVVGLASIWRLTAGARVLSL